MEPVVEDYLSFLLVDGFLWTRKPSSGLAACGNKITGKGLINLGNLCTVYNSYYSEIMDVLLLMIFVLVKMN